MSPKDFSAAVLFLVGLIGFLIKRAWDANDAKVRDHDIGLSQAHLRISAHDARIGIVETRCAMAHKEKT